MKLCKRGKASLAVVTILSCTNHAALASIHNFDSAAGGRKASKDDHNMSKQQSF